MERLERKVRKELVEDLAETMYQLMLTPEYDAFIGSLKEDLVNGIAEAFKETGYTQQELDEAKEEIRQKISPAFELSALKAEAYKTAAQSYSTRAEKARELRDGRSKLEKLIENKEVIGELKAAEEPILAGLDITDRVVEGVVAAAKKNGIESALAKESIDEVYRQIFPTAEAYLAFLKGTIDAGNNYLACVSKAVSSSEFMKEAPGIAPMLVSVVTRAMAYIQQESMKTAEQNAKRIYGGK